MFSLPESARLALRMLHDGGYEAYIVGGCVRDYLRGAVPSDIDITTSALPEEIKAVFAGFRTFDTGIRHGTVTVLIGRDTFEVTTYRVDGAYSDGRHPDGVTFSRSLREDAARRDFTVNAMAYCEETGVVDFFGGQADLAAGVLRCVGDPVTRFTEDSLRILRAMRFSATLGYRIEAQTSAAMMQCAPLMVRVSAERIWTELAKLLCGKNAPEVLAEYLPVLSPALPELADSLPMAERIAQRCGRLPAEPSIRLAGLLYGSPEQKVAAAVTRLKTDNRTKNTVLALCADPGAPIPADRPAVRRLVGSLGPENALLWLAVRWADTESEAVKAAEELCRSVIQNGDCCRIASLEIDGGMLSPLHGAEIGRMLQALLDEVIDGRLKNERGALLERAKALIDSENDLPGESSGGKEEI